MTLHKVLIILFTITQASSTSTTILLSLDGLVLLRKISKVLQLGRNTLPIQGLMAHLTTPIIQAFSPQFQSAKSYHKIFMVRLVGQMREVALLSILPQALR